MKPRQASPNAGFALIVTLMFLMLATILVVAYLSAVRSDRAASQTFSDHNSAEAMAMGVLNRIIADHALPQIDGKPLAPFAVDGTSANATGLPTATTVNNYFGTSGSINPDARKKLAPIYEMVPDDETVFEKIGLVRVSKPTTSSTGATAYNADYWAYDGLTPAVLGAAVPNPPQPSQSNIPQWIDYYENDPATGVRKQYPTAKIAYAIWDEGGKLDINMAGEDKSINGVAPHNLQLENEFTNSPEQKQKLLDYLNNADAGDGVRERNNFSLRTIAPTGGTNASLNDTGDDRWSFSVRELVEKKLIDPAKLREITTMSRDFDVRPEWDGDRASLKLRREEGRFSKFGAEDYLRSYINNPDLFDLFFKVSSVDPYGFVNSTLDDSALSKALLATYPGMTGGVQKNWMQIMRFLAILRRAMPPGIVTAPTGEGKNITMNVWSNNDVWGIALNAMQATAPAADHNLFASKGTNGFGDPDTREGIRISPYITAMSVKIKRILPTSTATMDTPVFTATEYITVWNPFPYIETGVDGTAIKYRAGSYTTGFQDGRGMSGVPDKQYLPSPVRDTWPLPLAGLHSASPDSTGQQTSVETSDSWGDVSGIAPGHFAYVRLPARQITPMMLKYQSQWNVKTIGVANDPNAVPGFLDHERTYVRNTSYYGLWDYNISLPAPQVETVYYSVNMTLPYWSNTADNHTWAYIPPSQMPKNPGQVAWFSFQIDDPRMGALPRHVDHTTFMSDPTQPQKGAEYRYSWWGYPGSHSIDFNQLKTQFKDEVTSDFTPYYNGKSFSVSGSSVAGYNANFGVNWPGASSTAGIPSNDQSDFDLMMATFGLPGRPFLNVGELGNVFAERPWTTIGFANKISPLDTTITAAKNDYTTSGADTGNPPPRPSALLDYFTTVGTPTDSVRLNYRNPSPNPTTTSLAANVNQRYQEKDWLFDEVTGTNDMTSQSAEVPSGNLRPIRGRINLNTASEAALTTLLKAPYRMPASIGLKDISKNLNWTLTNVDSTAQSDYWVTIDDGLAQKFASLIAKPVSASDSIRPLRTISDLSRIYDVDVDDMNQILKRYPASIINAIFGRLAQFGTVRSQAYTIDMVVRALHPEIEKRRLSNPSIKSAVTSEVHLQARVYLDTFSRKTFIESIQYR